MPKIKRPYIAHTVREGDNPSASTLARARGRRQEIYQKPVLAYVIGLLLGGMPYALLFSLGYQHATSFLQPSAFYNVFFYSLSLFYSSLGDFPPLVLPLCLVGQVILGIACITSSRSRFVGLGILTIVGVFATFFMLWQGL